MIRKTLVVVTAVVALAGCSTTVAGNPVVDPSALPRPDTGSFPTAPRTVEPVNDRQMVAAEGYRMAETIPLPPDIDPAIRYDGGMSVGRLPGLKATFGEGVSTSLEGFEVGAYVRATDKRPGSAEPLGGRQLLMGVFRMKDAAAASAAVANPAVLGAEKGLMGAEPAKEPVSIPGYGAAKAFAKNWTTLNTVATTAVVASDRYVLVAYSNAGVESVRKFFDLQIKALEGFKPTPVDRFGTLPKDRDGLLRYTVGGSSTRDVTVGARVALVDQSDITASRKNFDDAGVDLVARGANLVYRAKDAAGASLLAARFIDEIKGFHSGVSESRVTGVPGGRCLTFPEYPNAKTSDSYCVVPVGRYLAEVTDPQQARAAQALGASYLILRNAA